MLILKSASPRRQQILKSLNLEFQIDPSPINEDRKDQELPISYLKRVTISKLDIDNCLPENVYLSSDTIVVLENEILGKPSDFSDGVRIISLLAGKSHSVYSGMGILKEGKILFEYDETKVEFKPWKSKEIETYLNKYKPYDKAGAYGIQDQDGPVIRFEGSYLNVLGFPIRKFYQHFTIWKEFLG